MVPASAARSPGIDLSVKWKGMRKGLKHSSPRFPSADFSGNPGCPAHALPRSCLQDNPEVTKVSDMARHAGEAWRAIQPDKRAEYEKMSADNKVPPLSP